MSDGPELRWATPAEWAERVLERPDELLSDHAHCELGAAASAQALIVRHPGASGLVAPLATLAAEEMRHFRRVHDVLVRRGGVLLPTRRNAYAEGLVGAIDRGRTEALCDRLLVSALIERRSLERFELLAAAAGRRLELSELAVLFAELGPSEAGHARRFVELARELFPETDVDGRLAVWARREAALVRGLPFAHRIHSGPPARVQERTARADAELSAAEQAAGGRA